MKRLIILFIILLVPFFVIKEYKVFKASKEGPFLSGATKVASSQVQRPFVIISYGKNNVEYVDKHFDSILNQNYKNFRIVHIDDRSTDGSYRRIIDYLAQKKPKQSVQVLQTAETKTILEVYCEVVKNCEDEEVILHLEGNDWLFSQDVLSRLNNIYANKGVWLTYSQYLEYPSYKKGKKEPLPKRALTHKRVQKYPWVTSPFKTYYAKVFKQLCFEDCIGDRSKTLNQKAFLLMEPMVKMAKNHIRYIPEVLYVHNRLGDNHLQLGSFEKEFTKHLGGGEDKHLLEQSVDIVIFSKKYSSQLEQFVRSIYDHVNGNYQIYLFILDQIIPDSFQSTFPKVHFSSVNREDFRSSLLNILFDEESPSHFVILTTDDVKVEEDISLNECITALMKTRAYGFYFHLGKSLQEEALIKNSVFGEHIYLWPIEETSLSPDELKWSLYRKREIESDFLNMQFSDVESLVDAWGKLKRERRIGLFYDKSPIAIIESPQGKQKG